MSADAADVRVRNANLTLHEHVKPEQGAHTHTPPPPEQREPGTERGRQMAMTDSSRSPGVMAEEFTPFKGLACTNPPPPAPFLHVYSAKGPQLNTHKHTSP